MTWNDFYTLWMNEELEFEGALWQDINPIIVLLGDLEEREGQDDEYTIQLKEEVETLKEALLQKYN
tara:strand:- start:373 stop:570 length:198 start_codon:yes stop_codon:yes gene_type:complete